MMTAAMFQALTLSAQYDHGSCSSVLARVLPHRNTHLFSQTNSDAISTLTKVSVELGPFSLHTILHVFIQQPCEHLPPVFQEL